MARRAIIVGALLALGACSETPAPGTIDQERCPAGQIYDRSAGRCIARTDLSDAGGEGDTATIIVPGAWEDGDGDLMLDRFDNCPLEPNPDQADADRDGVGDQCDRCPMAADHDQFDLNANGIGDACEEEQAPYDADFDADNDGAPERSDTCPGTPNPGQEDTDSDGRGDACDNCRDAPNYNQADEDDNGRGDACEPRPAGAICLNQPNSPTRIKPNIFIVLDRSGSMCGTPQDPDLTRCAQAAANSKWANAKAALDTIADDLFDEANFGISLFGNYDGVDPKTECSSAVILPMGSHAAATIKNKYRFTNPFGGTPTHTALEDVRRTKSYEIANDPMDASRPKAIVLITDGRPRTATDCDDGHAGALREIKALAQAGVKTYAVGFGSGVSVGQLREYAVAGGTNDYRLASNALTLADELDAIARELIGCSFVLERALDSDRDDPDKIWVTAEIDGAPRTIVRDPVEGFAYDAAANSVTLRGRSCDAIKQGSQVSVTIDIGCRTSCEPLSDEVCDYVDNDCDGEVDEGCSSCSPEVCDGVDNDCDGTKDEGCCQIQGASCQSDAECCFGFCDPESSVCAEPCRPVGVSCTESSQCCDNSCIIPSGAPEGRCAAG